MLKLLTLISLYFSSCSESRPIMAASYAVPVFEKIVLLEAANQQSAGEAQSIIYNLCASEQIEITQQEYGKILLRFWVHISFPERFNQMMDRIAQVPNLKILQ